jgi:hypothetical protein
MTAPAFVEVRLEPKPVGKIEGRFYVPRYQRGYRWGSAEVDRLLSDIDDSREGGQSYYLQPIVVKPMPDGRWELVDGQQRLTTLYLILQYIRREALPKARIAFELEYETRPGSQGYLADPDGSLGGSNIDFFHIYNSHERIRRWFDAQDDPTLAAMDFYKDLSERVKVIWYEAPHEDSTTLFTRLNVGRIPLTDAELTKALVLTRSRDGHTDQAHSVAAQWDAIERDLRKPELWAFVTGDAQEQPTHLSLLLDTLADSLDPSYTGVLTGRGRPPFHTFETLRPKIEEDWEAVWAQVIDLHSLVQGWYDDRTLYHKIGYLIATGYEFAKIVVKADSVTKSGFEARLDGLIRERLNLTVGELRDLGYDNSDRCGQALLLMNVETIRAMRDSSERYSFRAHASGTWSLEHIHAQNAEPLRTAEQWRVWLKLHREALVGLPQESERDDLLTAIDDVLAKEISALAFRTVEEQVARFFTPPGGEVAAGVHSIANLALLAGGDNTALSNSVFEVKRQEIIRLDREGSYIPVCTRNVFLKYYTAANGQQFHFWGNPDREGYLSAMVAVVGPYLKPEEDLDA